MPKNDRKTWTREDIKALREQARDRNVSTDKIAKNLGPRADGDLPRAAWATAEPPISERRLGGYPSS